MVGGTCACMHMHMTKLKSENSKSETEKSKSEKKSGHIWNLENLKNWHLKISMYAHDKAARGISLLRKIKHIAKTMKIANSKLKIENWKSKIEKQNLN